MSYELEAVIGRTALLQNHLKDYPGLFLIPLMNEYAFIPTAYGIVEDEVEDCWLGLPDTPVRFYHLSSFLADWLARISVDGRVAYVEATGQVHIDQAAAVWENGKVVHHITGHFDGPDSPIDKALRFLGVTRGSAYDEFDSLGLGEFRDSEGVVLKRVIEELFGSEKACLGSWEMTYSVDELLRMTFYDHPLRRVTEIVLSEAIWHLGRIGPEAAMAIPRLKEIAEASTTHRASALWALIKVDFSLIPYVFERLLIEKEEDLTTQILTDLLRMVEGSAFEAGLFTKFDLSRWGTWTLYRSYCLSNKNFLEFMSSILQGHEDARIRENAVSASHLQLESAMTAYGIMKQALKDPDQNVRKSAAEDLAFTRKQLKSKFGLEIVESPSPD